MPFATAKFYQDCYLLGREPPMPIEDFAFWEARAAEQINLFTLGRIDKPALSRHKKAIGRCACELAEYLYMNEGAENKQSETIQGRSTTYVEGVPYRICQRHLSATGLMYRGQGYASP